MEIEFRRSYFVYIAINQKTHFNVNITIDLQEILAGGSSCLVYCEVYHDKFTAVKRETELAFLPQRKLRKLVMAANPGLELIAEPISMPKIEAQDMD
jgi:hypothetical protein